MGFFMSSYRFLVSTEGACLSVIFLEFFTLAYCIVHKGKVIQNLYSWLERVINIVSFNFYS